MPRKSPHLLVFLALCAAAAPVQPPCAQAQVESNDAILAGPKVPASSLRSVAKRPTIVHRSFEGTIERAGAEPGRTACEAMRDAGGDFALNEDEQVALETTIAARAVALDALLRENYDALVSLQNLGARATSPSIAVRLGALADLARAMNRFDPYFERGSFIDEFARGEGVREARVAQAREIEKRYIDALVRESQLQGSARNANATTKLRVAAKPNAGGLQEFGIRARLRLEHFGALLKDAIEAKVQFGVAEFNRFADELNLDATQREKIQALLGPLFIAQLAKTATPQMRAKVFSQVYAICDLEQRRALLTYIAANKSASR